MDYYRILSRVPVLYSTPLLPSFLWIVVCICSSQSPNLSLALVHVCVFSPVWLFVTLWAVACQARLLCPWNSPARILEWVVLSCSRGIFLTQGLNLHLLCLLHSPALAGIFFTTELPGKPITCLSVSPLVTISLILRSVNLFHLKKKKFICFIFIRCHM